MPPHSFPHRAEIRRLGILVPTISLTCKAAEFLQFVCPRLDDCLEPPMAPNLPKLSHLHKLQVLPSPHPRWGPGDHAACLRCPAHQRGQRLRGAAGSSPGCLITGEGEKSPSQDTQETKAELRLDPGLPPPSPPPARWPLRGFKRKQETLCLGIHVHCRFTTMLKSCLVKATIFHLKIQISTCSLKTTSSGKQRPTSP